MKAKHLVIFSGIPASGKTTYYKTYFSETHSLVSLDCLKTRKKEISELMRLISEEHNIVIDNTNPTPDVRARYIEIARANGYLVVGYEFRISMRDAIKRNSDRECSVNPIAIYAINKKMVRMGAEEGFAKITIIHSSKQ